MRFLVDAQLPPGLAERLRSLGHQADHVNRIGLGSASDRAIWDHALKTGAVVITKDADFPALAILRSVGPAIVWVRLGNTTSTALGARFEEAMPEILTGLSAGERLIELR